MRILKIVRNFKPKVAKKKALEGQKGDPEAQKRSARGLYGTRRANYLEDPQDSAELRTQFSRKIHLRGSEKGPGGSKASPRGPKLGPRKPTILRILKIVRNFTPKVAKKKASEGQKRVPGDPN